MKKMLSKIIAISLCCLLVFSMAGCHEAGEKALNINGVEFTSSFYSCALVFADIEGQQMVYNTLGETAAADYLNQTLEGVPYKTWVKNRAIEQCREYAAYKIKCDELLLTCEDYSDQLVALADENWAAGDSAIFQENGVGRGTYRTYVSFESYKLGYFDYLYGDEGPKAIAAEELEKNIAENYTISNIISRDAETEEAAAAIVTELEAYATRIRQGEKFEKIYLENAGVADPQTSESEDSEYKGTFSYDLASLLGNENTNYESDYFEDIKAMENGEIKVMKKTNEAAEGENPTYTVLLIYKEDILGEHNTHIDDVKNEVRHYLKDKEYEEEMLEFSKTLTVTENEKATKRFKVEKIVYPAAY